MDPNLPLETELLADLLIALRAARSTARSPRGLPDGEQLDVLAQCRRDPRRGALVCALQAGGIGLKDLVPAQGIVHWDRINK